MQKANGFQFSRGKDLFTVVLSYDTHIGIMHLCKATDGSYEHFTGQYFITNKL